MRVCAVCTKNRRHNLLFKINGLKNPVSINRALLRSAYLTKPIFVHLCITMRDTRQKSRETHGFHGFLRRTIAFHGVEQGLHRCRRRELVNAMPQIKNMTSIVA
jgi:hypothetical protein